MASREWMLASTFNLSKFLLLSFAGLLAVGCAPKTSVVLDPSYDFSPPGNFAWAAVDPLKVAPDSKPLNPAATQILMDVTENVLADKGYSLVSRTDEADFAVGFTLGTREQMALIVYDDFTATDEMKDLVQSSTSSGSDERGEVTYNESQLAIDIFDAVTKKQVWHGTDAKPVTDMDRENPQEGLSELIDFILSSFPPGN